MLLTTALLIAFLVFLIILFTFYCLSKITLWSCFALAALFSLIILVLNYPPLRLIAEKSCWEAVLYSVVIAVFLLVLFLYIISRALVDRRCLSDSCLHCKTSCSSTEVASSDCVTPFYS